jgi:hypothetical protein
MRRCAQPSSNGCVTLLELIPKPRTTREIEASLRRRSQDRKSDSLLRRNGVVVHASLWVRAQDHLEEPAAPRVEAMGRPLDELSNY